MRTSSSKCRSQSGSTHAAIKRCPEQPAAWYHRGKIRASLGIPAAAATDFGEFLSKAGQADPDRVHDCVIALRHCAADAKPAVSPLLRLATDEAAGAALRCEAITTLGIVGRIAVTASAGLRKLASHENRKIAAVARAALAQIDPK